MISSVYTYCCLRDICSLKFLLPVICLDVHFETISLLMYIVLFKHFLPVLVNITVIVQIDDVHINVISKISMVYCAI